MKPQEILYSLHVPEYIPLEACLLKGVSLRRLMLDLHCYLVSKCGEVQCFRIRIHQFFFLFWVTYGLATYSI